MKELFDNTRNPIFMSNIADLGADLKLCPLQKHKPESDSCIIPGKSG